MNRLSVHALGVALGAMWGISVLFFGIAAWFGWGVPLVQAMSSFYLGFGASLPGAVIGGIWAFVDGYIGGVIVAWVYNKAAR